MNDPGQNKKHTEVYHFWRELTAHLNCHESPMCLKNLAGLVNPRLKSQIPEKLNHPKSPSLVPVHESTGPLNEDGWESAKANKTWVCSEIVSETIKTNTLHGIPENLTRNFSEDRQQRILNTPPPHTHTHTPEAAPCTEDRRLGILGLER